MLRSESNRKAAQRITEPLLACVVNQANQKRRSPVVWHPTPSGAESGERVMPRSVSGDKSGTDRGFPKSDSLDCDLKAKHKSEWPCSACQLHGRLDFTGSLTLADDGQTLFCSLTSDCAKNPSNYRRPQSIPGRPPRWYATTMPASEHLL